MKLFSIKAASAVSFIFIMLFATAGCVSQDETALKFTGTIEADRVDINSETAGTIENINFNEGDMIKAGDIAANLDTSALEIQKTQAQASVDSMNAKLNDLKAGTPKEQINQAKAAIDQIKANIDGQKKILDTLKTSESDLENALNSTLDPAGKTSLSQNLTEIKTKIYSTESMIDSLNDQYNAAAEQLKFLQNGPTQNSIDSASAAVKQAQASLDLINLQIEKSSLKSPIDGTVIYKLASVGQVVTPGTPVLTVSDLKNLWVKFYIPEKSLSKIKLGQEVKIVSDSYPGKGFNGKIIFISSQGEFTPKNVETKEEGSKVYYAFKVKLLDGLDELRPGMMVDVSLE